MNRTIIPDTWPPVKHNVPEDPPPFGSRPQNRERECAGCGIIGRWGNSLWCPTCRADSPAVQPTDLGHAPSRRTYIAAVYARRDLLAVPLEPVAPAYADWACLRCGDDCEDPSECWCVACQRELAKGA